MKMQLSIASITLAAALFSFPAFAQPSPATEGAVSNPSSTAVSPGNAQGVGQGMGQGQRGMGKSKRDCGQSRNPEYCKTRQEARQKAVEECKGQKGPEFRRCVHDKMPPPDCTKAANPERCNAMIKAHEICKEKAGPDRRQCMREQFTKK